MSVQLYVIYCKGDNEEFHIVGKHGDFIKYIVYLDNNLFNPKGCGGVYHLAQSRVKLNACHFNLVVLNTYLLEI